MQQSSFSPEQNRLIIVGGGVRSGKSRYALERARALPGRRIFIATAQAGDEEMVARIDAHRRERADNFLTIEAPYDIVSALEQHRQADVIVIDCMTLLVSNLLLDWSGTTSEALRLTAHLTEHFKVLLTALRAVNGTVICITNEVGMGVVPPSPLGRLYRDLLGIANQQLARAADELYLAILGQVLRLKPGPVELDENHG